MIPNFSVTKIDAGDKIKVSREDLVRVIENTCDKNQFCGTEKIVGFVNIQLYKSFLK